MDIAAFLDHWTIAMQAQGIRPRTIETYMLAVKQLIAFLDREGLSRDPSLIDRNTIREFINSVMNRTSAATAKQRLASLRQFFKWLVNEDMLERSPVEGITPPRVVEKPIETISQAQFDALIEGCDDTFTGRRDAAILWLLWDSGLRLGEVAGIRVEDVNLFDKLVFIRETKGGGVRTALYTPETQYAMSRYQLQREKHKAVAESSYWLGKKGVLGERGISQMVSRRSEAVGFHAFTHMFRHTFADRWLDSGGSEGDLLRVVGWSNGSRGMLDRYGKAGQTRRAQNSYRRLVG